ncbi:MAG: autotransporter-associated beta strand repeat-containing protein, partial [Chthoniobacterales bacterium]
ITGGSTITGGTLQIGDGGTTGTLTGNITNNALLVVDRSDAVTLAGDIFGSGTLTQSGAGTLTLTGNNSYAGGTSITNGLINFATLANLSTGPVTLNGGGLQWATGSTVDVSGLLAPLGSAGGIFDTNGNAVTLASALSGSGALTKIGAGTLTLGTANTYTGGTTVSGGTLAVSSGSNLGTGPVHVTGSGQLSGGNSILILNTSVSIDSPSAALTSTNALEFGNAATGSLAISGGGTVNASTYVGIGLATATASASVTGAGSSLTTGDLYIGATGGTGSLAIGDGGTVTANTVYFGYVGGSGTLDLNAGGTLATGGISSPGTAHFNLSGGTVKVTGSGLTTSVAATLSNASTINTNGLSALFSGNLSGNGSLNKTGAGALTLTGNNSYNGGTSVTAGTLVKASDHAAGTGAIVVSGGVFLINNGVNATDNAVTLSGGEYDRTLSASANLANAVNASSSFADGNPDTIASILQGTLTTGATLQTSFANMSSALNDTSRISDVYSFHGTGTDTFVLQLSMTSVNAESMLVWLDTSTNTWVNAVFGNTGTNDILFVNGAYDGDLVLGHYGVDVSTGSVWAVLDHNSDFAAVPEPATVDLIALGFGLIILRKRKA